MTTSKFVFSLALVGLLAGAGTLGMNARAEGEAKGEKCGYKNCNCEKKTCKCKHNRKKTKGSCADEGCAAKDEAATEAKQ